jgi:hypothetical protein
MQPMVMVLLRAVAPKSAAAGRLAGVACCLIATGCGSSGSSPPTKPLAQRLCDGARTAAAAQLGATVQARIVDPAASNLVCSLRGRRLHVKVVSQASADAYTEFDTETSHQSQVYGAGIHDASQQPVPVTVPGSVVAVWIRAQKMIVATDATPTAAGGSYVTVTVSGKRATNRAARSLAQAVARATFAAHPGAAS